MGSQPVYIWLLLPFSFVLFYVWVRWENHFARLGYAPMVDLSIFRSASYRNGLAISSHWAGSRVSHLGRKIVAGGITLTDVPLAYAGSAGAIMQTAQRVGASIGIALITAITFTTLSYFSWGIAINIDFASIIILFIFALLVAIQDLR